MAVSIDKILGKKEDPEEALTRLQKEFSLSDKQRDFVYHYVRTDGNRRVAGMDAGYVADKRALIEDEYNQSVAAKKARNVMGVTTTTLMKNPKIKNAIAQFESIYKNRKKSEVQDDVYKNTHLMATYDIRDFADALVGDSAIEIAEKIRNLPEDVSKAITGIEFKYLGKDADRFVANFKFADRHKSMEFLAKLTGMLVDRKEINNVGNSLPTINIAVMGGPGSEVKTTRMAKKVEAEDE